MVEIAICLAVIGFALVAIIGVLPTGMQVQRQNREETIINQDGTYFMEAIRSGSKGLDDLTNYVMEVSVTEADPKCNLGPCCAPSTPPLITVPCPGKRISGTNIIGALSTPQCWFSIPATDCDPPSDTRIVYRTHARVRSISGAAAEKGDTNTMTFEYMLTSEIVPFHAIDPNIMSNAPQVNLQRNLFELRLIFRWPILHNGNIGNSRKLFRTMLSGSFETNKDFGYFFQAGNYTAAPTNAPFWPVPMFQ